MKTPIFTGYHGKCHIQGIAVDKQNGYIYYSFTTKLIKATLEGEIIGSVDGLVGHLGCIAFNEEDGCVYGSLEYKSDSIGRGILKNLGTDVKFDDAFYVVKFDVSKIDRPDTDAHDVMTAIYLKEVVDDYNGDGIGKDGSPVPHRHGCSGIDGLTFAPHPNKKHLCLYVAYGVYSDINRDDNDYQVLLCFDHTEWKRYEKPLDQNNMHVSGPAKPLDKFFVYTTLPTVCRILNTISLPNAYLWRCTEAQNPSMKTTHCLRLTVLFHPKPKKSVRCFFSNQRVGISLTGQRDFTPSVTVAGLYPAINRLRTVSAHISTTINLMDFILSYFNKNRAETARFFTLSIFYIPFYCLLIQFHCNWYQICYPLLQGF